MHKGFWIDYMRNFRAKELCGPTLRQYLDDSFDGKKAETATSAMTFYRGSLAKFLQFLGKRSDDPMKAQLPMSEWASPT
jgi:hypothetical protein